MNRLERNADPIGSAGLLSELAGRLETHFASEQSDDGLFDLIASNAPERVGALDELRKEHAIFLSKVTALRGRAQALEQHSRDLRRGIDELLAGLRQHETTEEELLVEALEHEIAAAD